MAVELEGGLVIVRAGRIGEHPAVVAEMQQRAEFVEISSAGMRESHVHDVQITKEAPNYRAE